MSKEWLKKREKEKYIGWERGKKYIQWEGDRDRDRETTKKQIRGK